MTTGKNKEQFTYDELMALIVSGCKYRYFSYNHKKAIEEYNTNKKFELDRKYFPNPNSCEIPKELKEKYMVEKIGRLRRVDFMPNGKAWRFYIGNKYAKTFKIEDFGVNVFPII